MLIEHLGANDMNFNTARRSIYMQPGGVWLEKDRLCAELALFRNKKRHEQIDKLCQWLNTQAIKSPKGNIYRFSVARRECGKNKNSKINTF